MRDSVANSWRRRALLLASLFTLLSWPQSLQAESEFPPSPYDILKSRHLETPLVDAVTYCRPDGLDSTLDPIFEQADARQWKDARGMVSEWSEALDRPGAALVIFDAVLFARAASTREELRAAEERFRDLLRMEATRRHRICGRLELARLLLLLGRESEAAAQLTRAEKAVEEADASATRADSVSEIVAFYRAEILYQRGRRFDAHLGYRKLAKSKDPRLALAARLRLTDLSFDAGKTESVTAEYEALLPRAEAFGASIEGWALRASEAALDAGFPSRALRWLERFLEAAPPRDARDVAEIRVADLDVAFDDGLNARKRLSALSGRRRGDMIGALAAVRAIDLGVAAGSPDQRLDILLLTLREHTRGVRRYALGVLMAELAHRGDLDGGLAVATRLAYEGVDPVVTPDYVEVLGELLERAVKRRTENDSCQGLVRALGGRYGILIERADRAKPFVEVGLCFEEMELPWLAATVYRTVTRRFGALGAQSVALPLARSSLAIGEVALARRVAAAALEEPDENAPSWKAILAEADFIEGRFDAAAKGLRGVLDVPELEVARGKLVRLLALTLSGGTADSAGMKPPSRRALEDADYLRDRLPSWLREGTPGPAAHAALTESALLVAHAYRAAGRRQDARSLYALVDQVAGPGALRSSSRFWRGIEDVAQGGADSAWGEDLAVTLGPPWARYAQFERHLVPLLDAYGASAQGSAP